MTEQSIDAGVPFRWVATNSIYGVSDEKHTLRHAGISYVLAIKGNHWFGSWATEPLIAEETKDSTAKLPDQAWHRLSAGSGTKGKRLYDWTYHPMADLNAEEFDCSSPKPRTRGLLIRRNFANKDST